MPEGEREKQVHLLDVPEGSTVVGLGIVYVADDGSVACSLRVQSKRQQDLQAFSIVLQRSLDDFKRKHGLRADEEGFVLQRNDN